MNLSKTEGGVFVFAKQFPELILLSCAHHSPHPSASMQHAHAVLEYCLSGSGVLTVRGHSFPIEAGNCFAILPNTPYTLTATDDWDSIRVEFTGTQTITLLSKSGISEHSPVFPWQGNPKIQSHFLQLLRLSSCDKYAEKLGELSVLYGLFAGMIILNVDPNSRTVSERTHDVVLDTINYIKKNYTKPLAVKELAEYSHLNRSYFSFLFHKQTGLSPQQFLVRLRLWVACKRLSDLTLKILAIANSVGYETSMTFSQVFRRTLGISPSQFRERSEQERSELVQTLGVAEFVSDLKL